MYLHMLVESGNHPNPLVKVSVIIPWLQSETLLYITLQLLIADPFIIPRMEWLTYLLEQFS